MVVSPSQAGSWEIDLTLTYPDTNDVTRLNPLTFFVFREWFMKMMTNDGRPDM
jgi:hypothetical protein